MSIETSKQTLIDLINNQIKENNNNEITANVLNPVMLAIVEWISSAIGDGDDLSAGDLIESINSIASNSIVGFNLITGADDPNTTPPASFQEGDFYKRVSGITTIGWYQYNGIEWAEIRGKNLENYKNIRLISANGAVQEDDFTIIYQGAGSFTFDQEIASDHSERRLKFVNQAGASNTFSQSYIKHDGTTSTDMPAGSVVEIHSDGTNWHQV